MNPKSAKTMPLSVWPTLVWVLLCCGFAHSQSTPGGQKQPEQEPTFRTGTSLVLVDVFTLDPKTGLPLNTLKREDFQVFDNGKRVPIVTFDSGAHYDTRPVALWLVTLCNMKDWGELGSGLFLGKSSLFRSALEHLDSHDSIGVAHWCDNGEAEIDLPHGHDAGKALAALEKSLDKRDFNHPVCSAQLENSLCRQGEHALQRMLQLILKNARDTKPGPVPVIIFLHSDHTGMPAKEVEELVDNVLETSGIVFGIKNSSLPEWPTHWNNTNERGSILHYLSDETGGQYFKTPEDLYATVLDDILLQLHFRYELGFKPPTIDGRRHKLRVELVGDAKAGHKSARLRYRPEYIPVP
jgi:hypothetical protein